MGKKINIRPTTSVYATYKNIKYDPWTAIAEFVDNSTQSYYDHIDKLKQSKYWKGLDIEIEYFHSDNESEGFQLIIKDNAYGMNFQDFQRAIILDSPPKKQLEVNSVWDLKQRHVGLEQNGLLNPPPLDLMSNIRLLLMLTCSINIRMKRLKLLKLIVVLKSMAQL